MGYILTSIVLFIYLVGSNCYLSDDVVRMQAPPASNKPSPVIFVPGDGGSQGYMSINGSEFTSLWINLEYFFRISKLQEYFTLFYNHTTHKTHPPPGIKIDFPGWGDTWSIDNLDQIAHARTTYFGLMIDELKANPFYVSNFTMRGAPYDFRKAPNENGLFFSRMKHLVEETYVNAGGRRVMILGHSMGTLYSQCFLKGVPKSWKKKYIRGYIAMSGPLGGSVKAYKLEASGDNLGVFVDRPLKFRTVQRSMPSTAFLLPNPKLFGDFPLMITPQRNYSANDYEQFFKDINFTLGYQMRLDTEKLYDSLTDVPDVDELYCSYGTNISTMVQMIFYKATFYRSGFPDQKPTEIAGDGDGTVGRKSLDVCKRWPGVKYKTFPGAEHMGIVRDINVIKYIKSILEKGDSSDS